MLTETPEGTKELQGEIAGRSIESLGAMLLERIRLAPDALAFRYPDSDEVWHDLNWTEIGELTTAFGAALIGRGLNQEDRVAIISTTRLEWVLADLGNAMAACATSTIYPNTMAEDVAYILRDSDSRIVVAEDADQVAKITCHDDLVDAIPLIVVVNGVSDGERVIAWDEFLDEGRAYLAANPTCVDDRQAITTRDNLATLIYTSGTTGRPKGVRLKHSAWSYLAESVGLIDLVNEDMLAYLWLPLSHSFGKSMIAFQLRLGFKTAIDGRIDRITDNLGLIKPDFMCGVPRIFEKVRSAVLTGDTSRGVKGKIAHWAFATAYKAVPYRLANQEMPAVLKARFNVADKLVLSKLREKLGGRIQFMISGAAKLSPQVQKWFYAAGLIVVEGYGLTETATVNAVNHYRELVFGAVGRPIPGLECRIADDSEVLFRAPVVMEGYHKNPEATAAAIDADGWFHTGDTGYLDDRGFLFITDRKKDLIKTSGGKYVAPTKVEAALMANVPYISQAIAVGDGHKYVGALLVMEPESLMRWGKNRGHAGLTYAELSQLPEIRRSIDRFVAKANTHLDRWETVKQYAILDHELTLESGAVTESQKIRRARVIASHQEIVDSLFAGFEETIDAS
ncbi:MAG: long-chain fatty acid--CoA ligase [Propionibacteriaceae bacterium]|jgi:long-chain acyl-CoA synthetase|nr:long-chain fatty acid--CoA ligase [Propionibacteriaceae bacterium]